VTSGSDPILAGSIGDPLIKSKQRVADHEEVFTPENHSLKQRRPNKRARAYGIANRTVHNYGFIIASNQLAMI